jgi:beta-fructofuranosidase
MKERMNSFNNPAIVEAMAAIQEAVLLAEADPTRPVYHFRAPARWINDPNGPLYYNGYYHIFYQQNPFSDTDGPKYWGHTRSKDLVHWEHLPIALWPSHELGETDCFSGCGWINGRGEPILFYTKVNRSPGGGRPLGAANEQWAAVGDADLLTWRKHPANPILHLATHGGPRFADDWRDPFIFQEQGRFFMIVGACWDHGTPIYEAMDETLIRWAYRGILCNIATECPNFARLGDRWLYLSSPFRAVEYFVGDFDLETLRFTMETHGVLDPGYHRNAGFYASNLLWDAQGRCILLGWVRGFKAGRGWNGCFALPRILTLGDDNRPRQTPIPELAQLRGQHTRLPAVELHNEIRVLPGIAGDALEIVARFKPGSASRYGLKVRCTGDGAAGAVICYDGQVLNVAGATFPFRLATNEDELTLHIFLDKSVMEVFVNGGRACATRVIYPDETHRAAAAFAEGGGVLLPSVDAYAMKGVF